MLTIRPVELKTANEFVAALHRHHRPVVGHRFSIGCFDGGQLVGVCIVGRPVARMVDHTRVLEVTRLCTDGTPNACSKLYSAAARAGRELGYERIQTYILDTEPGTSLTAAGWVLAGMSPGGTWSVPSRHRVDKAPTTPKKRYERLLA